MIVVTTRPTSIFRSSNKVEIPKKHPKLHLSGVKILKPINKIMYIFTVIRAINICDKPFSARGFAGKLCGDMVIVLAGHISRKKTATPNSDKST
jgi:hypothetical protein